MTEQKNLSALIFIVIGLLILGAVAGYSQFKELEKLKQEIQAVKNKIATLGPGPIIDKSEKNQELTEEPQKTEIKIGENDHIRGNKEAAITIVEFSDFQCPFCAMFHPTVQRVLKDYPGKVRWVYKHFPLSFHQEAQPAAEASECIAEQTGDDGFWQFADGLFENQERLGKELYRELAQKIGVDINQFESCFSSGKYKDKVKADYQEGIEAGVGGTPGSFINGKAVPGAVPYETLKGMVEKELIDNQ